MVSGLGFGAFQAVDQALMSEVLPSAAFGKDLGVVNIAATQPQTLARRWTAPSSLSSAATWRCSRSAAQPGGRLRAPGIRTLGTAELRGVIVWGTLKNQERRSAPFPDLLTVLLQERCDCAAYGKSRDSAPAARERSQSEGQA